MKIKPMDWNRNWAENIDGRLDVEIIQNRKMLGVLPSLFLLSFQNQSERKNGSPVICSRSQQKGYFSNICPLL
jgi:hypothetical protein